MQIKEANVFNYGKLQNQSYQFSPGINVIYGENEAGKSTLHAFLISMLFGMEKRKGRAASGDTYTKYEPWHAPAFYSGAIRFEVGEQPFYLERNFYVREKSEYLRNEADGEELSVAYGDLNMLLGGIKKETFGNTYDIPQTGAATGKEMAELLAEYLADAAEGGDGNVHVQKALKSLADQRREFTAKQKKIISEKEIVRKELQFEQELLERDCEELRKNKQKFEEEQKQILQQQKQAAPKVEKEQPKSYLKTVVFGMAAMMFLLLVSVPLHLTSEMLLGGEALIFLAAISLFVVGKKQYGKQKEISEQESETKEEDAKSQMADQFFVHSKKMVEQLSDDLLEKETRLFNLRESLTQMEEVSNEEQEVKDSIAALELAYTEIERISKDYYEEIEDELNAEVSRWVSILTMGKYDSVRLDDTGHIFVLADGKEVLPEQLSFGTLGQIYLAVRLGVGSIVTKEEDMPVFLDEAFAMYDDRRLKQTLKALAGTGKQILIFTCQKREAHMLEQEGITYHSVNLA